MNNPINCIVNNITPAKQYIENLTTIIQLCHQHCANSNSAIQEAFTDLDIEFALEDLPKLLDLIRLSSDRIQDISVSLRNFSRSDSTSKIAVNLHDGLDSTLIILGHRLKAVGSHPAIKILKTYGDLPEVECYPGPLNQVFMNILANAIDAIEDAAPSTPQIQIQTLIVDNTAIIQISDNGNGIPASIQSQLFDPLFTTKPVGKGTGLGLSIARQIVEDQHGGKLRVVTELHQGTLFEICLPIRLP
ncbi:sensor histidine kinase [Phormidesmis priestleyi]